MDHWTSSVHVCGAQSFWHASFLLQGSENHHRLIGECGSKRTAFDVESISDDVWQHFAHNRIVLIRTLIILDWQFFSDTSFNICEAALSLSLDAKSGDQVISFRSPSHQPGHQFWVRSPSHQPGRPSHQPDYQVANLITKSPIRWPSQDLTQVRN